MCSCFCGDQWRWLVFDHSIGSFGPFKALWHSHRQNKSSHIAIIISTIIKIIVRREVAISPMHNVHQLHIKV